jgi:FAD/FMN-containing dehydrogenase
VKRIEPSSPGYTDARRIYQGLNNQVPRAIVQPKSADEVAQVVASAAKNGIKMTIRSGGHNIPGQCLQQNSLTIDMRHIKHVWISPDRQSATVGGGAKNLQVAQALETEGLMTPLGFVGTVGFVGWSTLGGYGSFMNRWGLGVDNILGATTVNWEGKVEEGSKS